jgi:hypothetical protein
VERQAARPEISAFPLDNELVRYDARTSEAHLLNPTGVLIWQLCNGSHTLPRLAQETAFAFGISYRQALADVEEFVALLDNADLVTFA